MMNDTQQLAELNAMIEGIADQLCDTVDNNFDITVSVDTDNEQAQKLSLLINFLLENVRRNVGKLAQLNEQLETRVKERTELLDLVISGTDDGVWVWFFNEQRIEFSEKWYSMLGLPYSSEHASPSYWTKRIHPRDRARLYMAFRSAIEGHQSVLNVEYRIRHEAGGYRWMLCRGACSRDSSAQPYLLAGTQTDITELKSIDPKSGLANEHYLKERIEDAIDQQEHFCLALFSLDQIEGATLVDEYSDIGQLEASVAEGLITGIDITSTIARVSTSTFAVFRKIAEGSDLTLESREDERRLREIFNESFCGKANIRLSLGVVASDELQLTSAADALNAASSVLRYSKQFGSVQYYDSSFREMTARRFSIEEKLRIGVTNGCIQPWFQPIYSGRDRRLVGFEALARMICLDDGHVPPDEFIPIAEEKSLMWQVGDCILRQSILLAKVLSEGFPGGQHCYVGVNVSAQQFITGGLADFVLELLDEYKLNPQHLRLELTESVLVDNFEQVRSQLYVLRRAGIKIALDDFGTGYSSLSYLRYLPIDVIKIDRSFVTDLDKQERKAAIVKTIISLAQLLKLDVVAEGIETEDELSALNAMADLSIQGYLFSPAIKEMEALELVSGCTKAA